jgi:protein SCO1/2
MKFGFWLTLIFSQVASAHSGHEHSLKAQSPLPGTSIFQLESEWKNQNGQSVKLASLRGSPRLLVMLYTRCETACPLIVEDLKEIAKDVDTKKDRKIDVSIFSLDSFRETPESLSQFSVKRKLPSHWGLFTSNADAVAELAASLGVRYRRLPNGDFIHSNVIYFLNANGEIVAQKEGIKSPRGEFIKKINKEL